MDNKGLTICSVCYKSYLFIWENIKLTGKLNANSPYAIHWRISDNTPIAERLGNAEKHAQMIVNCQKRTTLEWLEGFDPAMFAGNDSLHHSAALNFLLKEVQTRYLLIIDPDFFALTPHWISTFIDQIQSTKIGVIGAPVNPKWHMTQRSSPAVYFLLVDRTAIDITQIDFSPKVWINPPKPHRDAPDILNRLKIKLRKILIPLDGLFWGFYNRKYIGRSRDTGSGLGDIISSRGLKYHLLTPVFRPQDDLPSPSFWWRFGDIFYPDSKRFVPRKTNFFSTRGFREANSTDFRSLGCEEYLWEGHPFGVHFRGHPKRNDLNLASDQKAFIEAINRYTAQ